MSGPTGPTQAELDMPASVALAGALRDAAERLQRLAGNLEAGHASRVFPPRLLVLASDALADVNRLERSVVVLEGFCRGISFLPRPAPEVAS